LLEHHGHETLISQVGNERRNETFAAFIARMHDDSNSSSERSYLFGKSSAHTLPSLKADIREPSLFTDQLFSWDSEKREENTL
jgi:hypothetical protein